MHTLRSKQLAASTANPTETELMKPLYALACLFGAFNLMPLAANADEAQAMPSRQTLLT
jgi:hypothetical protein